MNNPTYWTIAAVVISLICLLATATFLIVARAALKQGIADTDRFDKLLALQLSVFTDGTVWAVIRIDKTLVMSGLVVRSVVDQAIELEDARRG